MLDDVAATAPEAEPATDVPTPMISRRQAIGYTAMLASATLLTGCELDPLAPYQAPSASTPLLGDGFLFNHEESVFVIISTSGEDDTLFDLTVRVDGKDTEFFEGLNGNTVNDIVSDHVSVASISIPTYG